MDVCVNLDHGKDHSRISCKFVGRRETNDGKWEEDNHEVNIGNEKCRKDNAIIIKKKLGLF